MNGTPHICKLTLGALVELESNSDDRSLVAMIERFESQAFTARDVFALLFAGLKGGGWTGSEEELLAAQIQGGIGGAAKAAARLLYLSFASPDET